jgi:TolB-like protein/lipoprotein NlpI
MSLFSELKRRNVFRVGAAYIIVAWLIIQVAETLFPLFGFGDGPARIVVIVLAIGFVPVLIISWAFELTPDGLKRDSDVDPEFSIAPHTGKKLDRTIMVVLLLALAYFGFDKFVLDPQRDVEITESATRAGAEQAREEARLGMFSDKSVAVLPFTNRSEQKEDEYFTDGMHDELLTRLSRFAALKVISRTSVMHYRDTEKTIPEIARELSVATILEGGVQRSGKQVRINVQLIDARTDQHLWAEIYDRELTAENLFAIQSEISTAIAEALKATLSPEEKTQVTDLPTSSLEAYNHYLRARQFMAARGREDLELALTEFEQATSIDPEFALAWVGVADATHLLFEIGAIERFEHQESHKQAVEKALALNDQLGEAYASLAFYYGDLEEYEEEKAALLRAIELNPNYAQAYHWYANILSGPEREEKRLELLYKAAQLDPNSSVVLLNIATALDDLGRDEESRQQLEHIIQIDPDFVASYSFLGHLDAGNGELASAIRWHRKAMHLDPGNGDYMQSAAEMYLAIGDIDTAIEIHGQMSERLGAGSQKVLGLGYYILVAQSAWSDLVKQLEDLPPQYQATRFVWRGYKFAYMFAGDFENALESTLKMSPYIEDRKLWAQEFTDKERIDCEAAGILVEAGDRDLGEDLVRLLIANYETPAPGREIGADRGWEMLACYLVDGAFEKALDIVDQETAQGRKLDYWWLWKQLPWWKQLGDDPRYIALVGRIETMLDQQRDLLSETDESKDLVP